MEKQYGICYTYENDSCMEWYASDEFDHWVFDLDNILNCLEVDKAWELERVDGTIAFLKQL